MVYIFETKNVDFILWEEISQYHADTFFNAKQLCKE